jgi:hypothetical protein
MSKASDINSLYSRFGGRPDTYQEITQKKSLSEARKRWSLLRAIDGEELPAQEAMVQVSFPQDAHRKTREEFSAPQSGHEHGADVGGQASGLDLDALRRPASRRRVTSVQEVPVLSRDDAGERSDLRRVSEAWGGSRSKVGVATSVSRQVPSLDEAEVPTRKDQAISDVFSKLAGRKKSQTEPVKPQGIFGALRKAVRK